MKELTSKILAFFSRIFRNPTDSNEMFKRQWQDFDDGRWYTLYAGQNTQTLAKRKKASSSLCLSNLK